MEDIRNNTSLIGIGLVILLAGMYLGFIVFLLVFASVLLLRRKEKYGDILILFFLILILSDSYEASLNFAKLIKGPFLALMFIICLKDMKRFTFNSRFFLSFIPFFLVGLISLFRTETFFISTQKYLSYIFLFITIPNYFLKACESEGVNFFKKLCYFYVVILVLGFFWGWIDYDLAYSHGGRLRGFFGNPNGLGLMLTVFFALFFLINSLFKGLFSKWEKLFIYIVLAFLVLKCGSRNTMSSIGILLVLFPLARFSAFFSLVIFSMTIIFYDELFNLLLEAIVSLNLEEVFRLETLESGAGRYVVWDFAWDHIQENFFFGKGFAFDEYIISQYRMFLSDLGHEGGVHNTYLIIWLNAGLIGLITFLTAFFIKFYQASKNNILAVPIMFSFMFSIMFEPWLAASLNPYTSVYLMIMTLMIYKDYFKTNELVLHEE